MCRCHIASVTVPVSRFSSKTLRAFALCAIMGKRMQPSNVDGVLIKDLLDKTISKSQLQTITDCEGKLIDFSFQDGKNKPAETSLYKNRDLLKLGLSHNTCNIWNKQTLVQGFAKYNKANDNIITNAAPPNKRHLILEDNAIRLQSLFQELNTQKRSMTSGLRKPNWLKELINMIDGEDCSSSNALVLASPNKKQSGGMSPDRAVVTFRSPPQSSNGSTKKADACSER